MMFKDQNRMLRAQAMGDFWRFSNDRRTRGVSFSTRQKVFKALFYPKKSWKNL